MIDIGVIILMWLVIGYLSGQIYFWAIQSPLNVVVFAKLVLSSIGGLISVIIYAYQYIKHRNLFKKKLW